MNGGVPRPMTNGVGHRTLGIGCGTSDVGHQTLGTGRRDPGLRTQPFRGFAVTSTAAFRGSDAA